MAVTAAGHNTLGDAARTDDAARRESG